jgi:hypothetical protein
MLTISLWPSIQATCKGVYPLVLHRFTLLSHSKDIVNILLKCNSSVNLCGTNGYTPLHVACRNGHIDIVNILLKCNSSVNLCATNGYTPLHVACRNGSVWPLSQATCKGVYPLVSHRFTLLLHFSKMLTISIWPFLQARCKGVYPLVTHRFTLLLHCL